MAGRESNAPLLPGGVGKQERPKEPRKGEFVKSIVHAGLDAIVTSFSLISSISAGRLSCVDVLVLGFANLVADGTSMGFGDFVSSSTERDVAAKERSVAQWDVQNRRRNQQQALAERYLALGMSPIDSARVCYTKAMIAGQNYAVSTTTTLFNGAIAGAAAYAIRCSVFASLIVCEDVLVDDLISLSGF